MGGIDKADKDISFGRLDRSAGFKPDISLDPYRAGAQESHHVQLGNGDMGENQNFIDRPVGLNLQESIWNYQHSKAPYIVACSLHRG